MSYHYKTGVFKTFLQEHLRLVTVAVSMIFIATTAIASLTVRAATPNWNAVPGSKIVFSCLGNGSLYDHTLKTVVPGAGGSFTGTGEYDADPSYTWNIAGTVSGDILNATVTYTGAAAGSVYNLTNGAIASDGSVSGAADSNCQSFTMPAGSFSKVTSTEQNVYGNTGVENQKGAWMFNRDPSTATAFEFVEGAGTIGDGSVHVGPITNTNYSGIETIPVNNPNRDKFIAEYFARESVANFDSLSYDFKIAGTGTNASANQFYANFYVTLADNTSFRDCRFDFIPTTGSTSIFTTYTVTKDTIGVNGGGASCPASMKLNDMPAGSYIRAIGINVGDTSASDTGLEGYIDNVVFETNDALTVYDLEPYLQAVTNKDECKDGGWEYGLSYEQAYVFKNQGDCVSYFASKMKNKPANTTPTNARR